MYLVLRPSHSGAVIEIVRQGRDLRLRGMHLGLGLSLGHPALQLECRVLGGGGCGHGLLQPRPRVLLAVPESRPGVDLQHIDRETRVDPTQVQLIDQLVSVSDQGVRRVNKSENFADVIYGSPHTFILRVTSETDVPSVMMFVLFLSVFLSMKCLLVAGELAVAERVRGLVHVALTEAGRR